MEKIQPLVAQGAERLWLRRILFMVILLFSLVIRSAWTPEVLEQHRSDVQRNTLLVAQGVDRVEGGGFLGRP